jgi:hypothetical protein
MRYLLLLLACTAVWGAQAGTTDLQTIVNRHVAARGGAPAMRAVTVFESDIRIVEPEFTVDGSYVATRDGRMRIDISADGKRVFTEALDSGGAWTWTPDAGVRPGSAQAAAALRRGIEFPFRFFGLDEMGDRGHVLELAGRESVEGIDYHVMKLKLDEGSEVRFYVNPVTWLIDRDRQFRALHVDVDPRPEWIETSYEEYRPVAGVMFPHRQVERHLETGNLLSTVTVKEIRVNPPLDAGRFAQP